MALTLKLIQPTETATGIQKEIEVTLDAQRNSVTVRHQLANKNPWPVELAPWALTVMQGPGRAILPQEPSSNDCCRSARGLVGLHQYGRSTMEMGREIHPTRLQPRRHDGAENRPGQQTGMGRLLSRRTGLSQARRLRSRRGLSRFWLQRRMLHNGDMLEVESLGPLTKLAPNATVEHVERWYLCRAKIGESDHEIEVAMAPLLRQSP